MNPDIYIQDDRYEFEVARITDLLRAHEDKRQEIYPRQLDPAALYDAIHSALRFTDLDLGEVNVVAGRAEPQRYGDLIQELADLEPECGFDVSRVRYVLAEHGVYPERCRSVEDVAA